MAIDFKRLEYPYPFIPADARRAILPERNVCSIAPADEQSDYFYTGNGSHKADVSGRPYSDECVISQELLYEPLWKETPLPPDLRPILPQVRKLLLEGKPGEAEALVDQAQIDAGFEKYMNFGAKSVMPSPIGHLHDALYLTYKQPDAGGTKNYLRWLDLLSGKITSHWENARGVFETATLPAYDGDLIIQRLTAPKGQLDVDVIVKIPGGTGLWGWPVLPGSTHTLDKRPDLFTLSMAYNPEFGPRGYVAVVRFVRTGGKTEVTENGIRVSGADSLIVMTKAVSFYDGDFAFGCEKPIAEALLKVNPDFDAMLQVNRDYFTTRMSRSRLYLGKPEDYVLSGEELLERAKYAEELDPMLMDKLYDMGRFFLISDTGKLPPMWGQHNINTNLQVCAGNSTGLLEEMDVYFRYYETKFDDFRTNAKLLFGARGLLASVHCNVDSGLYYHFSRTYPHYCWTGCLGWIYNELWGYWLVTGDREFLRTRLVPALKEIALFYKDYACDRGPDGKVIFYPSFSPENPTPNPDYTTVTCQNINPTRINSVMDIAICGEVLDNLITACRTLGIEEVNIAGWQEQRASLPTYLFDEGGGLKEWAWPTIEENYNHRHVSHHYDVWPGRAVTPEIEPEIARAIQISNRKRGQQDDSAHGIIHRAFSAIRLKDLEEMEQNVSQLVNHGFVRRNLATTHFPYRGQCPDPQGSIPAILLELCVFSMPGTVEFLPAMPQAFPSGKIEGIWLYTWAKLESLAWTPAGLTATIQSNQAQTITLRCRRPMKALLVNGKNLPLAGDHAEYTFAAGETAAVEIRF
jgi:alpha-L-fucosidase 2